MLMHCRRHGALGMAAVVVEEDLDSQASRAPYFARYQLFHSHPWMDGLEAGIRGIGELSWPPGPINRGLSVLEDGQAGMV